jgi:predicted permease
MDNISDILNLLITILLPMVLGYFFKFINLFDEKEINALRKFVVKVGIPFLIFKNLSSSNIESLNQFFPAFCGFFILTVTSLFFGYFVSNYISRDKEKQNAFAFTVFVGNYAFLGWGVIHSFYGEQALTRAVFFTMLFWPVFLLCGFWLIHKKSKEAHISRKVFLEALFKNASIPIFTAAVAIALNLLQVKIPPIGKNFIDKFSAITIPMILFTIGLNLKLRMKYSDLKIVFAASFFRLIFSFAFGLVAVVITRLLLPVDLLTQKVILIESIMPTAAMATFYIEYINMDKKLVSGIIAFSTILSLATIPFWYFIVEKIL